ncbi:MAG: hypothetical protein Cons2KO_19850 [Congregibacter sp.]
MVWRIAAVVLGMSVASASLAQDLLIRQVTPIDPVLGALEIQDVMIRGGKIAAMGGSDGARRSEGRGEGATINRNGDQKSKVDELDGRGKFLIPGLWDMHVHFTYDARLTTPMAALFTRYGITSVRDTGGVLEKVLAVQEELAANSTAPRLYFSGPLLDGERVVYDGHGVPELGVAVPTVEEAYRRVDELAAAGASFIKIYEMVSPEVFHALAERAAIHGLPIAAHVPLSMRAVDAGPRVDSIEHMRNLEFACAAESDVLHRERQDSLSAKPETSNYALRASIHKAQRDRAFSKQDPERCEALLSALRDTIQVPTIRLVAMTQFPPFESPGWEEALNQLPAALKAEWQRAPEFMDPRTFRSSGEWALDFVRKLHAADVPIGAGTDTPIGWSVPGYSLHRELQILTRAGLSNLNALAAATVVPAQFLGRQDRDGRLAPGYTADLVLLSANPLEDIANTLKIDEVLIGGVRALPGD